MDKRRNKFPKIIALNAHRSTLYLELPALPGEGGVEGEYGGENCRDEACINVATPKSTILI